MSARTDEDTACLTLEEILRELGDAKFVNDDAVTLPRIVTPKTLHAMQRRRRGRVGGELRRVGAKDHARAGGAAVKLVVITDTGESVEARCDACRHWLRYFGGGACDELSVNTGEGPMHLNTTDRFGCVLFEPKETA